MTTKTEGWSESLRGRSVAQDNLLESLPSSGPVLNELLECIRPFWTSHGDGLTHSNDFSDSSRAALSQVFTQIANELADLLVDLSGLQGRTAVKGTRTLVELYLTYRALLSEARGEDVLKHQCADRYLDHALLSQRASARLGRVAERLPRGTRGSVLHRAKKLLRDTTGDEEELVVRYGPEFRRGWSKYTVAALADLFGEDDYYTFYRVASSILHGSSGGMVGLESGGGLVRVGPAPDLAPLAYIYGMSVWKDLLRLAQPLMEERAYARTSAALDAALELYPGYREAALAIADRYWAEATEALQSAVVVLVEPGAASLLEVKLTEPYAYREVQPVTQDGRDFLALAAGRSSQLNEGQAQILVRPVPADLRGDWLPADSLSPQLVDAVWTRIREAQRAR